MFIWSKKKEVPDSGLKVKRPLSEEELVKAGYRIGKFSPSNCECPPAPDIIPIWVANNVEAFDLPVDRLLSEVDIPNEFLPKFFLAIFEGFRDLIHSCPNAGNSPFALGRGDVIEISKGIFIQLAQKKGVALDIPS